MIGISTSYFSRLDDDIRVNLKALRDMGFRTIEIDFRWDEKMCKKLRKFAAEENIKISSLHNFCPIPKGGKSNLASPESYLLSSEDEKERKLAVKFTKATIENAVGLKAKVVVLHCGKVFSNTFTKALIRMYNGNQKGSKVYREELNSIVSMREKSAKKSFSNLLKSLKELDKFAGVKKIKLGVETRYYFGEIPQVDELAQILDIFDESSSVGYWHDVGHAQCLENLGFCKVTDFLNFFDRLVGIHLHDIRGCEDHLAPFEGDFDFGIIAPYVKSSAIKTIEAHQPASQKSIIEAKIKLEKLFDE